jgi:hypothetical protein
LSGAATTTLDRAAVAAVDPSGQVDDMLGLRT